jgi:HAD superfamily hydrolase (TIGR01509 family)
LFLEGLSEVVCLLGPSLSDLATGSVAPALLFDVEGTLVDCVGQTLESWRETLADFGLSVSIEELHAFSGMDGGEMLDLLQRESRKTLGPKKEILREQGLRYREKFLPTVAPFPGIRSLFETARQAGWRIALATSCQPDELKYYGAMLDISDLVEAVACGEDVQRGKPHPDLHRLALRRLDVDGREAMAVGDTPFDATAAAQAGIAGVVGTLTGGFSVAALQAAGCGLVVEQPADLLGMIAARKPAHPS